MLSKKFAASHSVIVVSNAKDGRNNSNHFYNVLKQPLDLSHGQWSVGVKKIIYHNTMMTIVDESLSYHTTGHYRSPKEESITASYKWKQVSGFKVWHRVHITRRFELQVWIEEPLDVLEINIFPRPQAEGQPQIKEVFYNIHTNFPWRKEWHLFSLFPSDIKHYVLEMKWTTMGKVVHIPSGHYASLEKLCKEINRQVATQTEHFRFTLWDDNAKCRLEIKSSDIESVVLNSDLNITLGFDERRFTAPQTFAPHPPQLDRGRFAMFLYSNIVEYSPVGDAQAPLLDVISLPRQKFGDIVSIEVAQPTYRPVVIKQLGEIEILCTSDTGEPMPFTESNSKTLVELHFINTSAHLA